jgi:hypothetical protein
MQPTDHISIADVYVPSQSINSGARYHRVQTEIYIKLHEYLIEGEIYRSQSWVYQLLLQVHEQDQNLRYVHDHRGQQKCYLVLNLDVLEFRKIESILDQKMILTNFR